MTRETEIIDRMRKRYTALKVLGKDAELGAVTGVCSTTTTGDGQRHIVVTMTTDDIDLDSEVLVPDGADMSYLSTNNKVFVDHRYDLEYTVGTIRYIKKVSMAGRVAGLECKIALASGLRSPFADDCWTLASQCGGIGASVGFEPKEVGKSIAGDPAHYKDAKRVIRKWKLLELSLTCLPCNVNCQGQAVRYDDTKLANVGELVGKSVIRRESAMALGYTDKPVRKMRIVLEN